VFLKGARLRNRMMVWAIVAIGALSFIVLGSSYVC
jgi:hypothetical protein